MSFKYLNTRPLELCSLLVFTCVSLSLTNQAQAEGHFLQKRTRICGTQLVDALALICNNVYYSPVVKRGHPLFATNNDHWWRRLHQSSDSQLPLSSDFMDGQLAMSILTKRDTLERMSRGANDECCKKSCSYAELSAYCGTVDNSY